MCFLARPSEDCVNYALRVLTYLVCAKDDNKLVLGGTEVKLVAACDSDWAGDNESRKSTRGHVVYVTDRGACICRAALQKIISLSSTEAEYISATWCAKAVLWVRMLLAELGHRQQGPTQVYIDNQSAIHLTRDDP